MKYVLILIVGLFAVACASETKEEIKDMKDILPSSERDYDKKDSIVEKHEDTLEIYQNRFSGLGELMSISTYDENLFPDRFGPKRIEKYTLNWEGEEVVFVKWRFSDSVKVTNALFNWLDCFGPKCKSIRVAEESNLQQNAFLVLANDSVLVYLESEKRLSNENWDEYFEMNDYDELDWNYRMEQNPRGRVRWFAYHDEEKTPIKNE